MARRGRITLHAWGRAALPAGIAAAAAVLASAPLAPAPPPAAAAPARAAVFVSILPQQALVERIGGDRVQVEVMVGPGQSPETYAPTPRQMAALGQAVAYFSIGVPFEQAFLPKIARTLPELAIIDTRAGIALRPWSERAGGGGEADASGAADHAHGAADPHVWLDPELGRALARNVEAGLARLDPAHADEFAHNRADLDAELVRTRQKMAALLEPYRGSRFYVFHPAFGYLAAAFGLGQVPIQEGGHEPSARQLAALIDSARADGVRALFVQPQYSPRSAKAVADAIGAKIVPLDDLAPDYPEALVDLARRLADAFAQATPRR